MSLGRGARRGCGLVVAPDRVAVLARSLMGDDVEVRLAGGTRNGILAGVDRSVGIAVLDVPTGDAAPIRWADAPPAIGQRVVALGDPGGTGLRATEGRVSADPLMIRGRSGRRLEVVEHTAPLPRGTGGGPLLDEDGAVLGVNALRGDPGFILALTASVVRPAVEGVLEGRVRPRRIGVALAPPHAARRMRRAVGLPDRDGLLIRDVEDGGPAQRAGLRAGDLLVRAGATDLTSVDDLVRELDAGPDGAPLPVRFLRGADEHEAEIHP
ncbi:MAG: S1C family serine protease, partial [Actinomycetota bacterium]